MKYSKRKIMRGRKLLREIKKIRKEMEQILKYGAIPKIFISKDDNINIKELGDIHYGTIVRVGEENDK